MNKLGTDINGAVVVIKEGYRLLPPSAEGPDERDAARLFYVNATHAGEGAYRQASGHLIFGHWLGSGKRAVVDAREVVRLARLVDVADANVDLRCLYCDGTGSIGDFRCVICGGTGEFTPITPLEV